MDEDQKKMAEALGINPGLIVDGSIFKESGARREGLQLKARLEHARVGFEQSLSQHLRRITPAALRGEATDITPLVVHKTTREEGALTLTFQRSKVRTSRLGPDGQPLQEAYVITEFPVAAPLPPLADLEEQGLTIGSPFVPSFGEPKHDDKT